MSYDRHANQPKRNANCAVVSCPIALIESEEHIQPVMQDADREAPALGVYLLAAYLLEAGKSCDVVDWVQNPELSFTEVVSALCRYDVVFFSSNSMNWGLVKELARKLKIANSEAVCVVGGPHPTHYPKSVIESGVFDGLFRGEADKSIVSIFEVVTSGNLDDAAYLPGFAFCHEDEPPIHVVSQMNSLPEVDPAFQLVQSGRFKSLPVETSRGCKFQCTFCSIPSPKNWRCWDTDRTLRKLGHAYEHIEKTEHRVIAIIDDTFTTDHARILELARRLPEAKYRNRLSYDATLVDLQNEELVECLVPFTNGLLVGAEVSNKVDSKRIKKAATPQLIRNAAANLLKYGMSEKAVFSFIIGFPWHTAQDCIKLADFVKELSLEYGIRAYLQWYWPMPGSPIWNDLADEGRVNLKMVEESGYFLKEEWFYAVRDIPIPDIISLCERINLMKVLLNMYRKINGKDPRPALEFAMPRIKQLDNAWIN